MIIKPLGADELRIDIFLDEKKVIPADIANRHLISHGFTPATTIEDFPVRGKAVYLYLRRRKWLYTSDNTIHTQQFTLMANNYKFSDCHQWTQLPHVHEYVLFKCNIGERISIDETCLSQGELYTIITNKAAKGGKGALVAMIKGTKSRDVLYYLNVSSVN